MQEEERQALQDEIALLESRLDDAKRRLSADNPQLALEGIISTSSIIAQTSSLHTLLLLADSALPLGSFAFSSGLESFLAHNKVKANASFTDGTKQSLQVLFNGFLKLSLQSLASTALPYLLATYRDPERLDDFDNDLDASTPCTVARRASVAQGRALLSVWEKSFKGHSREANDTDRVLEGVKLDVIIKARLALESFSSSLRTSPNTLSANAHLAPLWGMITLLLGINLQSSTYLFLFSHARTVISAAVRASVLGPYHAQAVLASADLQQHITMLMENYWQRMPEYAGQSIPVMDLWVGRHEKLYSRIFNS
jgi:urease accessory protein